MSATRPYSSSTIILLALFLLMPWLDAVALTMDTTARVIPSESTLLTEKVQLDSTSITHIDSLQSAVADSLQKVAGDTLNLSRFNNWKPDPIRAMWLGMVIPGGGQIYNRKYWKLPIFYGGFVGCIYALGWNAQMLTDYSQAYQDIMDTDPTTNSHLEMLPLNYDITGREEHFKAVFKRKKDFYRRNRDLSIFVIAGVYVLSIVDAYVDAELSTFDISRDLSLKISPSVIPNSMACHTNIFDGSPGVSIQLTY